MPQKSSAQGESGAAARGKKMLYRRWFQEGVREGGRGGANGVRSGSVRAAAHNKNNLQQIKITPKRIINLNNPLAVDAQQQPHPLWQLPLSLLTPPPLHSFTCSVLSFWTRAATLLLLGGVLSAVNEIKCNVRGHKKLAHNNNNKYTHTHALARCARTVQSCPCKFNEFSALVVHGLVQGRGLSRELGERGNCGRQAMRFFGMTSLMIELYWASSPLTLSLSLSLSP